MKRQPKVVIVMPALNASSTLQKTVNDIPLKLRKHIILVDDHSSDDTVKIAKSLKLQVIKHNKRRGYGGNQKTCYKHALKLKPDVIVMIHPDYQYDSSLTDELIQPIIAGRFDIMLGSRIRTRAESLAGGMPFWKYISNRFLTLLENVILGLNMSEFHTGFRAYSSSVLTTTPFQNFSNDFIFDQQMIISAVHSNFRLGEIAVPVRYFPEASSINFRRSAKYGVSVLWTLLQYLFHERNLLRFKIFSV